MIAHSAVQSSTQTLFTLLAMITHLAVQSYTQLITSNDRSFSCPVIYTDTIHITSNNRPFDCSIIYIFYYFVPPIMHNTVVDPGFLKARGTNSRGRCTNLSFCKIFDDNCMKMKNFEPRGGAPSLDPLVLYKPSHSPTRMHSSRMRTTRSSSRWGGEPVPPQLPPWVWAWTRFPSTSQALPKKLHEIE